MIVLNSIVLFLLNLGSIILRTISIKVVASNDLRNGMLMGVLQASNSALSFYFSIDLALLGNLKLAVLVLFLSAVTGRFLGILINRKKGW